MAHAFQLRPLRAASRLAAASLAAFLLAPALVATTAGAAPTRPDAVLAAPSAIEKVAARKAHRAKSHRATRAKRASRAPEIVVIRGGAGDAVVTRGRRPDASDQPPMNVQYYDYGSGGYAPYAYEGGRRRGGGDYDRRYWRGGGPGHDRPSRGHSGDIGGVVRPGPRQGYSGDGPAVIRPRPGQGYSGEGGPQSGPYYQQPRPYQGGRDHGGAWRGGGGGGYTISPESGWMAGPPILQMGPAAPYRGPIQPGGVPLDSAGNAMGPLPRGR